MAPPGEDHIISLKMSTEYFKQRGWNTIFLGKSIPINSLLETLKTEKIDLIVLSALTQNSINSSSYLIEAIKSNLKDKTPKVLLGGYVTHPTNKKLIESFTDYKISSINGLSDYIEKIESQILNKFLYLYNSNNMIKYTIEIKFKILRRYTNEDFSSW